MRTVVRIFISALVVGGILVIGGEAPKASAQTQPETQTSNSSQSDYNFVAEPGCSLSVLTRRSLQLFDSQSDEVSLSGPQIIYAETNAVQEMGARLLDVNERVAISRDLIEKYAKSSQTLSDESLAAWSVYATRANFELSNINPVNSQPAGSTEDRPQAGTDNQNSGDTNDNSESNDDESAAATEEESQPNGEENQSSASFWIITALGAVAVYYIFSKKSQIQSSSKPSPVSKKSGKTNRKKK